MAQVGGYRHKIFEVSADLIHCVEGISAEQSIDTTTLEPQPATAKMTVKLFTALGIDVRKELESWQAMVGDGGMGKVFVGTRPLLSQDLYLMSLQVEEVELGPGDQLRSATLQLSFSEQGKNKASKAKSGGGKGSTDDDKKRQQAAIDAVLRAAKLSAQVGLTAATGGKNGTAGVTGFIYSGKP